MRRALPATAARECIAGGQRRLTFGEDARPSASEICSVSAMRSGRAYCGIEQSEEYCLWAEKRLARAESDRTIQGYVDGGFQERNSLPKRG